uniref:Uncharacterized protein n=1 Tax=Timema tahoe TaxID=61484 RepID=A0A7R9NZ57_9NEOP|nr:unnamed protein product [Timema tahoe]
MFQLSSLAVLLVACAAFAGAERKLPHHSGSQLARPCSKLAGRSINHSTLRANWPEPIPRLLAGLSTLALSEPTGQSLFQACWPSQLARPCSKLADRSINPSTLRADWPDTVPSLLTSISTLALSEPTGQTLFQAFLPIQLARAYSKLADWSINPSTLRANWPDPVPSFLTSLSTLALSDPTGQTLTSLLSLVCTRPGFRWGSTQPQPGCSDPGVHHLAVRSVLTPYLKPCSIKDPNFNSCAAKNGRLAIPFLAKDTEQYFIRDW